MKLNIDSLISTTGWVVPAPSEISENEHTQFVAGLNTKSLLIKFDASEATRKATKAFAQAFDTSAYDTLVLSAWSQQKGAQEYKQASDFSYKLKLNATQEFYFPVFNTFTDINIAIDDVDSIDRLEFTALHTDTDYLIISECLAEQEEIPLDVLLATKEYLEFLLNDEVGPGLYIGTLSGTAGDKKITLSAAWISQYSVILIDDGNNSETHQLGNGSAGEWSLGQNYDGKTLKNTYVDADVYLTFPVHINPDENEIQLPGIAVWGIDSDPILRGGKLDKILEGFPVSPEKFFERQEGQILQHTILIDCESRHSELIDTMTRIVRRMIARELLWINGRYNEVDFGGVPTETRPPLGVDIIPKVQYSMVVEVVENVNKRQELQKTLITNLNVDIQGG